MIHIIAATAVATLIMNLLLVGTLIRDRLVSQESGTKTRQPVSFVLTPPACLKDAADTDILEE